MNHMRVLVTGASSGIGRAVARIALAEGARVVVADRADVGLTDLHENGVADVHWVPMDVSDPHSVEAAFKSATAHWGTPPTAVVNAAGIYRVESTLNLSAEAWDEVMAVNVRGSMLVSQVAARAWRAANSPGSVVLVSSIASDRGDREEPGAHYAASKGAVVSLVRQLAVEWGPLGIRVNAVSPGVIDTPMLRLADDPQRLVTYLENGVPLGRLGRADEVAQAIWYLAGERASYVTGAVLAVDGGAGAA